MGCTSGGNSTGQVACLDRIQGGAAYPYFAILCQTAGTHTTLFAAHAGGANVARDHIIGAGERGSYSELLGANQHLLCSGIG